MIKIWKLTLIQCNSCRPYSNFTNCTNNILNRKRKSYTAPCIHLSCLVSFSLKHLVIGVFVVYDLTRGAVSEIVHGGILQPGR